ncbi:MAG: hypothetical protein RR280_06445 [Bacteroidaceae bacterium]
MKWLNFEATPQLFLRMANGGREQTRSFFGVLKGNDHTTLPKY